jgi:hypothetical protein
VRGRRSQIHKSNDKFNSKCHPYLRREEHEAEELQEVIVVELEEYVPFEMHYHSKPGIGIIDDSVALSRNWAFSKFKVTRSEKFERGQLERNLNYLRAGPKRVFSQNVVFRPMYWVSKKEICEKKTRE